MKLKTYSSSLLLLVIFVVNSLEIRAQERELKIDGQYLNLPIDNDGKRQRVKFLVKGEIVREFDARIADTKTDFWIPTDVTDFKSKKLTIQIEKPSNGLTAVYVSDTPKNFDDLYQEKLRPQVHFTSRRGWLNDPNGLVYHNGEYHLYYQYNPYGWYHGNMHWGHAVSKDLLHWKQLPIALRPTEYGDWAFSGAAVIDKNNSSGFGTLTNPPLVALFTSTARGECLVYSFDDGRTFTEYDKNPVFAHKGRDPKIFWYEPGQHWVMVVYDESIRETDTGKETKTRAFQIHTSNNLKNWTYQSTNHGFFECPELFALPVDGNSSNTKWVMYGGNGQYQIGDFDGKKFTPETPKYEFHHGNFHASQTFNNTPDGRRIQIGWGAGIASKGMSFNQLMLFPTELSLKTTAQGVRMLPLPVKEIESLHLKKHQWKDIILNGDNGLKTDIKNPLLHVIAEFEVMDDFEFGLIVNGYKINYQTLNYKLNEVYTRPVDGKIKMEILVDKTSIEIFANDGETYIPKSHQLNENELQVEAYSKSPDWDKGNRTQLNSLEVYELKSIWEK